MAEAVLLMTGPEKEDFVKIATGAILLLGHPTKFFFYNGICRD